jgi:hypothetical protein
MWSLLSLRHVWHVAGQDDMTPVTPPPAHLTRTEHLVSDHVSEGAARTQLLHVSNHRHEHDVRCHSVE